MVHHKPSSLSARRAWIENAVLASCALRAAVALRKESVDRKSLHSILSILYRLSLSARRAWIENNAFRHVISFLWSLSARRAWIENFVTWSNHAANCVALRKESVDRKLLALVLLPAAAVALRKESVDRKPHQGLQ